MGFYKSKFFVFFASASILVVLLFVLNNLFISLAGTLLFIVLFKKYKPYEKGLLGETDISDELRKLPPEYHFFSDIETDRSKANIDKVLIGPTGVWVIEVKNMQGKFTFDGQKLLKNGYPMPKDILSQTWKESYTIRDLIKERLNFGVTVQPVLVFSSSKAYFKFGMNKVKGIYIIGKKWLNQLVNEKTTQPLDPQTIDKISAIFKF